MQRYTIIVRGWAIFLGVTDQAASLVTISDRADLDVGAIPTAATPRGSAGGDRIDPSCRARSRTARGGGERRARFSHPGELLFVVLGACAAATNLLAFIN